MTTIAIVGTYDTKREEFDHLVTVIGELGARAVIVDTSTSPRHVSTAHITREKVWSALGSAWADRGDLPRGELMRQMTAAATLVVRDLVDQGQIQAVISAGGLQNSVAAAEIFAALPLGFPKLIVSTVASGRRPFDLLVGTRDVTVVPSITDLSGLNRISAAVLGNAAAAVVGMAGHRTRGVSLEPGPRVVVGASVMGVVSEGVLPVVEHLRADGDEVLCFHATGVGGRVLEEVTRAGLVTASLDLCLHEVAHEVLVGGFCAGATGRLEAAAERGIPMVVAPGAVDFVCFSRQDLPQEYADRRINWHNQNLAQVKVLPEEGERIARLIAARLNAARGPVVVLCPTRGLRAMGGPGESFADPEVDRAVVDTLRSELGPQIDVRELADNINGPAFVRAAIEAFTGLLGHDPKGTGK
jgi:uncharacterized protein (UPF0261 family)